ncbi:response regulator [Pinibacter aurantiacus]|uniref:Response regulator n=1 Tax=Pinibacter aurantiacus TaxID=2851599 RepID=A0A9E2SA86_9BACT|nr:response regulator [Pinibacter aurantiacus]MBV4359316.1 response regulator [Pinibacter aurantiacus]
MTQAKILLVDDDLEDRFLIEDSFKEIGVSDILHFEENGENALNYLEQSFYRDSLPCLIILDLNMPKMNGTQILRFLKGNDKFINIPVIIFSTSLNAIEKEECLRLGAYSYVIKPVFYKDSIDTARMFYDLSQQFSIS